MRQRRERTNLVGGQGIGIGTRKRASRVSPSVCLFAFGDCGEFVAGKNCHLLRADKYIQPESHPMTLRKDALTINSLAHFTYLEPCTLRWIAVLDALFFVVTG